MFGPVISHLWQPPRGSVLAAGPPAPSMEDTATSPPRDRVFPPIDVWPSPTGWSAAVSEFTPVTEAGADPPETRVGRRRQKLRMVRWLRPAYPAELAAAGIEGAVLLDLKIDPSRGAGRDQSDSELRIAAARPGGGARGESVEICATATEVAARCGEVSDRGPLSRWPRPAPPRECRGATRQSVPSAVRPGRRSRSASASHGCSESCAGASRACGAGTRSCQPVRGTDGTRTAGETAVRYGHDLSA